MSSLSLSCHLGYSHTARLANPPNPFALQRVVQVGCPPPPASLEYSIEDVTEIHHGEHTLVYRAILRNADREVSNKVVLKTDVNARYPRAAAFRKEAQRYERDLSLWQGTLVPRFYGLFEAMMYDKRVSVLVIEDCGESLNVLDGSLKPISHQIFALVSSLHACGFEHGDIAARNILRRDDGRVFLIDFERAESHCCGVKMHVIAGDFAPFILDFGCDELYHLARSLELWLPRNLSYFGMQIPHDAFTKGEAENLVSMIPSYMLPPDKHAWALELTMEMIGHVEEIRQVYAEVADEERHFVRLADGEPDVQGSDSDSSSSPSRSRSEPPDSDSGEDTPSA